LRIARGRICAFRREWPRCCSGMCESGPSGKHVVFFVICKWIWDDGRWFTGCRKWEWSTEGESASNVGAKGWGGVTNVWRLGRCNPPTDWRGCMRRVRCGPGLADLAVKRRSRVPRRLAVLDSHKERKGETRDVWLCFSEPPRDGT
jgi:hypothetical protein